jgi:4-amino-4-deoxy-L-arabinose transferase-like glycosyltransferase
MDGSMRRAVEMTSFRSWHAAVVLVAVTGLYALYNGTLMLSGDEAYYWVWSRHLQAGYHDHPPGIALAIAAVTAVFGDSVAALRLAASLCMAGAVWFMVLTARDLFGARAAAATLVLGLAMPAVQFGFTLATPDSPVVLMWAAGVYFGCRAVAGEGRSRDFLLAGLAAGAAMASKYTAVLLPAATMAFLLIRRRDLLRAPRTGLAIIGAVIAFAPVVWWNAHHDFESFRFQLDHGSARGEETAGLKSLGEFIGGQVLLLSPVFFGVLAWCVSRWRNWWQDDRRLYLMTCFLVPLALFLYKALTVKVQLNWAVPAYVSAIPLMAEFIVARNLRRTFVIGMAVALLLGAVTKWPLAFGLTDKRNLHNRLFGPEIAAAAVEDLREPGDAFFADHLQRASLLSFHLGGHPDVHIPTNTRFSEFSRWDECLYFPAMHGLYLSDGDKLAELQGIFPSVALVREVDAIRPGYRSQHYYIYRVGR